MRFIKWVVILAGGELQGKAALYVTLGMSLVLSALALWLSGAFSPPYPTDATGWITLIGGVITAIYTLANMAFQTFMKKVEARLLPAPLTKPQDSVY
jgi:hypothetical protein